MTSAGQVSAPVQILQITDFHLLADAEAAMLGINTEASFEAVLERVAEFPFVPDLFLLTGDLVQDPVPQTYRRLKPFLDALPAPVYCLPGNHDDPAMMREYLADGRQIHFQPHIRLDGWDIICLNSTIPESPCGHLSERELSLLETTLQTIAHDRHVLVSMHHPPMALGSRWLDTMMVGNAAELWARLEQHPNVSGIIIGHVHQELDEMVNGYRVLASPSTCFQFLPRNDDFAIDPVPPGFRWYRLNADGSIETGVERLSHVPSGLDLASVGY
jgi:Icc protein